MSTTDASPDAPTADQLARQQIAKLVDDALAGLRAQLAQFDEEHLPGLLDKWTRLAQEQTSAALAALEAGAKATTEALRRETEALIAEVKAAGQALIAENRHELEAMLDEADKRATALEARLAPKPTASPAPAPG